MIDQDDFKELFHEKIQLSNNSLPIAIGAMHKNAHSFGCQFHWHEQIEIYYIVSGGLRLNVGGCEHDLVAGDIGLVTFGQPHKGTSFKDNTHYHILHIDQQQLNYFNNLSDLLLPSYDILPFIKQDSYITTLLNKIVYEYNHHTIGSELMITGHLLNLFAHILRNYRTSKKLPSIKGSSESLSHVHEILSYINQHYQEHISLQDLAQEIGLSKEYMCRVFKKYTNQTIIQHLNEQKCHYSRSLILSGDSLAVAADKAGFENYNYFSRVYKKIMGSSPSAVVREE